MCAITLGALGQTCPSVDEAWDGGGSNNRWTTEQNWVGNPVDYPDSGDSVCLIEGSGYDECLFDASDFHDGDDIHVLGRSPTFFTLKTASYYLRPSSLYLYDYAKLEVDCCLESRGFTFVEDRVSVEVDSSTHCCLNDVVTPNNAAMHITGKAEADSLYSDAYEEANNTAFTKKGSGELVANEVRVRGVWDEGLTAYIGGLIHEAGTFTTRRLKMKGGDGTDRRAFLDIDENFTVKNQTTLNAFGTGGGEAGMGIVVIDIAPGKTIDLGRLKIVGPGELRFTGTESGAGQVITSQSEDASDNSCTCSDC